jgi:amidase
VPAHSCGIATIKPTAARVPVTGHFPRVGGMADSRTQIGPLARTLADCERALRIIAGPDGRDAGVVPVPLAESASIDVRGTRIATYDEVSGVRADADTQRALAGARRVLSDAGATVSEARPPRIDESHAITIGYWRRMRSYSWSEWTPRRGTDVSPEDIERSVFEWDRFNRGMIGFMEDYDLILTPASPWPAPLLGREDDVNDFIFTLAYSLTGYPCAVVRAGTSAGGLPIGVQIVARPLRDDVAIAAGMVVERAFGGWQAPPI